MSKGSDAAVLDVALLDGPTAAGVSPKRMAWNRFRRDRWAMVGLAVAAVYLLDPERAVYYLAAGTNIDE